MLMTFLALAAAAPLHFDCAGPVTPHTSAAALLGQYGKDARRETLRGPDGQMSHAVVLYPDDPSRRLEIVYWDAAQTAVERVTAGARAVAWRGPLGLHAGSPLLEVIAANGHNFGISGFDWDYSGYVTNGWGGKLSTLDGGCAVQVRFGLAGKAPRAIQGDLDLNSTLPAVRAADPHVVELSIGWPLPAGVKAVGG